jgi:hypothetical protein
MKENRPTAIKAHRPARKAPHGLKADGFGPAEKPETIAVCMEKIHIRAVTISPLLQGILDFRPPPHWGINK